MEKRVAEPTSKSYKDITSKNVKWISQAMENKKLYLKPRPATNQTSSAASPYDHESLNEGDEKSKI
jgi:hypothetical protein